MRPEPQTRLMVVALVESGKPGLERCLPRGCLAGAGLQHLAHEHLVDRVGWHTGSLDGSGDGDATQGRCRHVGERTSELADRRASGGDEVYGAVPAADESAIHALDATSPHHRPPGAVSVDDDPATLDDRSDKVLAEAVGEVTRILGVEDQEVGLLSGFEAADHGLRARAHGRH